MRVNVEDDLRSSGRLSKLARVMGWHEQRALGALVMFWRATQDAQIIFAPKSEIVNVTVIDFDSDNEIESFIDAMRAARLITEIDGILHIHGNEQHVDRVEGARKRGRMGGLAKAKTSMNSEAIAKLMPNNSLEPGYPPAPAPAPAPAPKGKKKNTKNLDLLVPEIDRSTDDEKGSKRTPAERARAKMVKDAFHAGYLRFYKKPIEHWGAPENSHVYQLLKSATAEVLALKAEAYFAWQKYEVIKAGHPFMNHNWSFSRTLCELTADVTAPQRRALAAQLAEREKISDTAAIDSDQINRIVTGESVDAYATGTTNTRLVEFTFGPPTESPSRADKGIGSGAQPQDVRDSAYGLLQAAQPVRADERALLSAVDAGGRGPDAIDWSNQGGDEGASGPRAVQADTATFIRGAKPQ